jgi:hypothetical protein
MIYPPNHNPNQPPPKHHGDKEKTLLIRQAGARERQTCSDRNEQVDAGMFPPEARMTDAQIELAVRHREEIVALEIQRNNETFDLQERYTSMTRALVARQQSERAELVSEKPGQSNH